MPKLKLMGAVSMLTYMGSYSDVCRNGEGLYVGSSAMVCAGITDATILETVFCREDLALACDLNCQRVHLVSDCKGVVEDIQRGNCGRNESIIREIEAMAKELDSCSFIFEGRASILEAHSLAKHALGLDVGRHLLLMKYPRVNSIL
jgi:hypothetical protein